VAEIASSGKVCEDQAEFDRAFNFLLSRKLVNCIYRTDTSRACQPNEVGDSWVSSHKEKWNPQARVAMLALVFLIASAALALLLKWLDSIFTE
jgi:hypothetical protein